MGIYSDFVHELSDSVLFQIKNMERMAGVWKRMKIIDDNEYQTFLDIINELEDKFNEVLQAL